MTTTREAILADARAIVTGARTTAYGTPEDAFMRIAELWSAYLGVRVRTTDVAIMMTLMKLARLAVNPAHRDSWVDVAGYAACGAECALAACADGDP